MARSATVQKRSVKSTAKRTKRPRITSSPKNGMVRARIDTKLKDEAEVVLKAIGLDTSTAFRLMMTRIATEKALPFDLHRPNADTPQAIRELKSGTGHKSATVAQLMADLDADD